MGKSPKAPKAVPAAAGKSSITRAQLYQRLEWFFERTPNPEGLTTIVDTASLDALHPGLTPLNLWQSLNEASRTYFPAWRARLFDGVQIPWTLPQPGVPGIKDAANFGDLVDCLVLSYQHAGFNVIEA
jgi:hypothetical protein